MSDTNVRFLAHNMLDRSGVTVTYSSEDTNFPGDNIRDDLRVKVWRTTGVASEYIQFQSSNKEKAAAIAIANTNLSGAAQITVRGDDDPANLQDSPPNAPAYEETFKAYETVFGFGEEGFGEHGFGGTLLPEELPLYVTIVRYFSNIQTLVPGSAGGQIADGSSVLTGGLGGGPLLTGGMGGREEAATPDTYVDTGRNERYYKAWRIKFEDPSNQDGYLEFGKIFLGPYFEPATGFSHNPAWQLTFVDPSKTDYSLGGQAYSDILTPYTTCTLSFNRLTEWEVIYNMRRLVHEFGTHKDLFVNLFPDTALHRVLTTFYGRFTRNSLSFGNPSYGRFTNTLTFRESV